MNKLIGLLTVLIVFSWGCFTHKKNNTVSDKKTISADTIVVVDYNKVKPKKEKNSAPYKGSNLRQHDLIHTKLEISFDIPNQKVFGKAEINLRPYFYAVDSVLLDAQDFNLDKVALLNKNGTLQDLKYKYNGKQITIYTPLYNRKDTFCLKIDYTVKPHKGLYFKNAKSNNPQIWTQGESDDNSGWFPTIDKPNERMTQEIIVTVDTAFQTLSNGVRNAVLLNTDGTKTVRWLQKQAHAPYLTALIVGRFDILKSYWRDTPVWVYAEPNQLNTAKKLFQNTVEMIDFFSHKLKYDFPWDKYSQVVVRDFISGAMENTGAVVFSDSYLPLSKNLYISPENETIVAHELFHHWFGDLVTCESWANLPLNEAFATYGEYLWLEHKYGRYTADSNLEDQKMIYFFMSLLKNKNLIRFHHDKSGDMFDEHSYQKGAAILHCLRYEVGDEAFFEALTYYLKKHAYSSVEVHDLRLAFEKITGRDLNYFFNNMFLDKGHLKLDIKYSTKDSLNWTIEVKQTQKLKKTPLYEFHVPVDFYFNNSVERKTVLLDKKEQKYHFSFKKKVKFVKYDAENSLLCKKEENRNLNDYIFILKKVNKYTDQEQAIRVLKPLVENENVANAFIEMLNNPYHLFRLKALQTISKNKNTKYFSRFKKKVEKMAKEDTSKSVRDYASRILNDI